jgi:hypothetical protein
MTTKMGFSGEYIKTLSPSDRKMYILYYDEELAEIEKRKQKGSAGNAPSIGAPMEM